jgi:hypothetical protein
MTPPIAACLLGIAVTLPAQEVTSESGRIPILRPPPPAPTPARIRGRVVDETDGSPVRWFTLYLFSAGMRAEQAPSGPEGMFDLDMTYERGIFEWAITSEGYDPTEGAVVLPPGGDLGAVRLRRATGVVDGRVLGPDGRPLSGANVSRHGPLQSPAEHAKTDEEGRFRFERVPKGRGYVRVSDSRTVAPTPVPFEARPWETAWVEVASPIGILSLEILPAQRVWGSSCGLRLRDPVRGRTATWRVVLPDSENHCYRSDSRICGGFHYGLFAPADGLLPVVESPEVSYEGSPLDVEVLEGGRHVLVRNVPAGTWSVEVVASRGTAPVGEVEVMAGSVTSVSLVVP